MAMTPVNARMEDRLPLVSLGAAPVVLLRCMLDVRWQCGHYQRNVTLAALVPPLQFRGWLECVGWQNLFAVNGQKTEPVVGPRNPAAGVQHVLHWLKPKPFVMRARKGLRM